MTAMRALVRTASSLEDIAYEAVTVHLIRERNGVASAATSSDDVHLEQLETSFRNLLTRQVRDLLRTFAGDLLPTALKRVRSAVHVRRDGRWWSTDQHWSKDIELAVEFGGTRDYTTDPRQAYAQAAAFNAADPGRADLAEVVRVDTFEHYTVTTAASCNACIPSEVPP
jgi:hypothetical protein